MGKKIVKINGKTYIVDEDNLEEAEVEEIKEKILKDEDEDEKIEKEDEEEDFDDKIDKAAEKIIAKLGLENMQNDISGLKEKVGKKAESKIAALVDLEKLMNKSVDEMTAKEKILGFFQGILRNDVAVLKVLSEGVAADGGYLFPDEFRYEIIRDIADNPHMRNEVRVLPMSKDVMKIPTLISGPKVTWTAEAAAKSTTTARFGQDTLTARKAAAIQYISDELIDDSSEIDVVKLVISLFAEAIGNEEDMVITNGNGTTQPTGYSIGGLGIQTVACVGNIDFDDIINLIYLLPQKYNKNAKFFIHRNNIRELRKIKDTNGRYLWQEPLAVGQPATIHGFPVIEDNNLPESEIYFGDMKYAYCLGDRQKMAVKISQDTETAFTHDETAVRITFRIAGTVVEARALKCLNSIP